MVDATLVTAKLADRVSRIRLHAKASAAELEADRDALELVSFNLMLAVQACTDVASHVIADEAWPPAASLADAFARLGDRGVISPSTRAALTRAVGLRNIVAPGYSGIDPTLVHAAATDGVRDLDAFAKELACWLESRGSARPVE